MVLLDMMGGVALLLWGLHMVHSGIVRAFGADLRRTLGGALRNRFKALAAGLGITALLQSSTATALMLTSFAAGGVISLVPALATMLGANIGTSLIVQLLSFNVSALAPMLLVVGVVAFRRGARTRTRDLGRVAIGLGLMLLSLHLLLNSLAPVEHSPLVRDVFAAATNEALVCLLIGALLTWAAHSSVAVVLLVMSLAQSQLIGVEAALAMVLGANLGAALNPLFEGGAAGNPASRRLPLGNLLNRLAGCLLLLPFLGPVADWLASVDPQPVRVAADFHILFNLAMALLFLPLLNPLARLLERFLPERAAPSDPGTPLYLDAAALDTPAVALACAARETLHMGDVVEGMFHRGMNALLSNDRKLVAEVSAMDDAVDRLHEAIKLYVIQLTRGSLEEHEGQRAMEIMSLSINLEHVGDIVDKNLMELAAKKIKHRLEFSREGAAELEAMHQHIAANFKLAASAFLTGDARVARQLLEEKTRLREIEQAAGESHMARLREGRPESLETSSLHLDVLRDLKRIHSHLCAAAYPVLDARGELRDSRLKLEAKASEEAAAADGLRPHSG